LRGRLRMSFHLSMRKQALLVSLCVNAILFCVLVNLSLAGKNVASPVQTRSAATTTRVGLMNHPTQQMFNSYTPSQYAPVVHVPRDLSAKAAFMNVPASQMRAAKVTSIIKLALDAGKANPAPPVGPALGAAGVNIMQFCKEYNAATQKQMGQVIPVEITVFADRSFTFILKTPPASKLLLQAAGLEKGSGTPDKETLATITQDQLKEIAEVKMPDLNAKDIEAAMRIVEGTAKNMGIKVAAAA